MLTSRGLEMPLYLWRQEWHKREKVKFLDSTQVLHRRGSRINTDRFPKRAPEVKACKLVWIRAFCGRVAVNGDRLNIFTR